LTPLTLIPEARNVKNLKAACVIAPRPFAPL
jgi:hypothetical protein